MVANDKLAFCRGKVDDLRSRGRKHGNESSKQKRLGLSSKRAFKSHKIELTRSNTSSPASSVVVSVRFKMTAYKA